MNNLGLRVCAISLPRFLFRNFSSSLVNNKNYSCKLLVLGGGSGGCTIAAKFAKLFDSEVKKSVIVVEPQEDHYYQALWTLVGAGIKYKEDSRRDMREVLPPEAVWVKDSAEHIDPSLNKVTTANKHVIEYEYLVVALGLKYDYHKVPGLQDALDDPISRVSTIFDHRYVDKVWEDMQQFTCGDAIFTYPDTPIKCPGAPQKIAYLFDSYLEKVGRRSTAKIRYNTHLPVIFGVPKYAEELLKVVKRKNIDVTYQTVLKEVRPRENVALFNFQKEGQTVEMKYSFLHVVPPMSPPDVLSKNELLVDKTGFLDVDKYTLQHTQYENIFGIGDCTNTPNSKTIAAIAKQCYVLEQNLLLTMCGMPLDYFYDGYGACPLVTSYNTCILAEFLYDGVIHETFPFDQSRESRIAYYMKRDLFPFIYWNFMLKGRYHGPEFVRKIFHPFENKKSSNVNTVPKEKQLHVKERT